MLKRKAPNKKRSEPCWTLEDLTLVVDNVWQTFTPYERAQMSNIQNEQQFVSGQFVFRETSTFNSGAQSYRSKVYRGL